MRPKGTYKAAHSLAARATEAAQHRARYTPPRVPVMLEHARSTQRHRLELVSSVFLCPPDLRLSEFMYNVRRKTKMPANIAVFLMADGLLVSLATTMGELYQQARDDDGWLYIVWTEESTFGCA